MRKIAAKRKCERFFRLLKSYAIFPSQICPPPHHASPHNQLFFGAYLVAPWAQWRRRVVLSKVVFRGDVFWVYMYFVSSCAFSLGPLICGASPLRKVPRTSPSGLRAATDQFALFGQSVLRCVSLICIPFMPTVIATHKLLPYTPPNWPFFPPGTRLPIPRGGPSDAPSGFDGLLLFVCSPCWIYFPAPSSS